MNNNLFFYWEGVEYKLIKRLRELIYLHSTNGKGYKVNFLNNLNLSNYVKELPECFNDLCIAHKADYIRVYVIAKYGGIWIDSDVIIMDKLDDLFNIINNQDGFFINENNQYLCNGLFGSKANTPLMNEWLNQINNILKLKKQNIEWTEIGNQILEKIIKETSYFNNYLIYNGLDNMYPINWDKCTEEFLLKPYENYKNIIRSFQPFIVLVNSVYKEYENVKYDNNENIPLNYFLKQSHINNLLSSNPKKIIIIADWIINYQAQEHFLFCKNLVKYGWKIIKLSEINIENIKKEKSIVLCVTYDDFDIKQLECNNVFLIYKIDDLYPYKEIREKCINSCNMIISPYQYLFLNENIISMYKNINNKTNYWIPYSCVNDFYKNIYFNKNPINNKIFISGTINNMYPMREYISSDYIFKDIIDILPHPNYNNYTHNQINTEYYKKLNNYLCCFTDASIYNYCLLKVYEITSVGSLLLVMDSIKTQLNILGFYDNINCIMCNKENLLEKMKWILDINNRQNVDKIRYNGMILSRKNHNTQKRTSFFNDIIDKLIKNNNKNKKKNKTKKKKYIKK